MRQFFFNQALHRFIVLKIINPIALYITAFKHKYRSYNRALTTWAVTPFDSLFRYPNLQFERIPHENYCCFILIWWRPVPSRFIQQPSATWQNFRLPTKAPATHFRSEPMRRSSIPFYGKELQSHTVAEMGPALHAKPLWCQAGSHTTIMTRRR